MIDVPAVRSGSWRDMALALTLSLLFLGGCIAWVHHDLQFVIGSNAIPLAEAWAEARHSPLPARVAGFALAVVTAHVLFGLVTWAMARLSVAALGLRRGTTTLMLIGAWTAYLALAVVAANAAWYPASTFARPWLRADWLGFKPAMWLIGVAALFAFAAGAVVLRRQWARATGRPVPIAMTVLAVAALAFLAAPGSAGKAASPSALPHVVIVGVDSLRNDLSEVAGGRRITPRIDAFLGEAHRFSDALSPLARTYPAWISILTGRHPVSTNARFNLMPRSLVREGDTLPDALRPLGYRSVYATDEVRFANIDESFGFDELITPPMGASDFLLGSVGDFPLVNLVAGSPAGRFVFPSNHANRAAHVTYRPAQFIARLERELAVSGPSLLAIHLTLAHWPYTWAEQAMPTTPQAWRPAYRASIEAVDRQFQEVLDLLQRKGVLDNAIVIVLSDHGDALGYPSDSMLRQTGTDREIWDSLWGHGTSVMSPHQYGVVLGMRAFGTARLPGEPASRDWPVSLEDLRPTIQELVTGGASAGVDGTSLVPYLAGRKSATELASRIRFTETCFNTVKLMKGEVSAAGIAHESARFFEIDAQTGWVQLRQDRLGEIMAKKQRAAISSEALLAAIPSWTDESVAYLYSSRSHPVPRPVTAPPDPQIEPDAARLWQALATRFPRELTSAAEAPRM